MTLTNCYCSLETLKARLGLTPADTSEDESLEAAIEAASRMIDEETATQFYAATQTRYFDTMSADEVRVDDLLSITTLATDMEGDGSWETTWATTDYVLAPYNAQLLSVPRPYTRVERQSFGAQFFPAGIAKGVQILGSWGFCTAATQPKAVESACLFQAEQIHRLYGAPGGEYGGGNFADQVKALGLHPFAKQQLAPFRRLSVG